MTRRWSTAVGQHTKASARTSAERRRLIVLYAVVVFLYLVGLYLYVPTLPTYIRDKAQNLALVGVALAQYGLWQALVRLPLGIAADWLGRRKPFILAGLVLVGLGALIMGMSERIGGMIVGRAVTGLAAGAWVPLVVSFSSLFPAEETVRATALLTLVNSAGRVVATASTGSLNALGGYRLPFFLAVGVAALATVILLSVRERRHPPKRPALGDVGRLVTRRNVLLPAILAAVVQYVVWASTFGFIPLLAENLGATDMTQSGLVSLYVGVVALGNLLTSAFGGRFRGSRLALFGFVLMTAGLTTVTMAQSLPLIFLAQCCIGMAEGISYPVLMGLSIRYVDDAHRTTAMGLHQSVYALGMFSGPWLSGLLADEIGFQPMFGSTAVACLTLGIIGTQMLTREETDV